MISYCVYLVTHTHTHTHTSGSQESCEQTLKLYNCYKRISDIEQEKGGASGGASGSRKGSTSGSGTVSLTSKLSLECTVLLLKSLFEYVLTSVVSIVIIIQMFQLRGAFISDFF